MKAAFKFRSSSLLLTSHSHVRPCTAVPRRQALLSQTDQAGRKSVCSLQAQVESSLRIPETSSIPPLSVPDGCVFVATTGKLTAWGVDLSTAQETTGRKQWQFPASLDFLPAPDHREGSHQLQTTLQPIKPFSLDSNL